MTTDRPFLHQSESLDPKAVAKEDAVEVIQMGFAMQNWSLAGTTAFVITVGASAAYAQVTPEEVWQNWQKLGASYGQAIVADSVVRQGDTLVVSNMKISMDQDGASLNGTLDEIRFRDLGDGTVEVTMSDVYPIQMKMPPEDGKTQELALTITQPGLKMIAGGNATETSYNFDGPTVNVAMQAIENGKAVVGVDLALTAMVGKYLVKTAGETSTLDSTVEAQGLSFQMNADENGNTATISGNLSGLKVASAGNFLGVAAMEDMAQALKQGFSTTLDLGYGAGTFQIDAVEAGRPTKITATNESGHFKLDLNGQALRYAAGGTGVNMVMSGADIPFPELKISYGEAAFDFLMPIAASTEPSAFAALLRIVDLSVSDEIWGMFDPTATLSREPATVVVDAKGTAKLAVDLFDEAAMAQLAGGPPGELNSLDLTEIRAKFAGAELTGAGAFTFDNTDLTTFDGVPAPTGKIDLVLKGGNGLLDKLVAMGLIPQDEAMGVRMMMAMFAKPGEGEDVLNSTLEFKDKGFFANGQRLQ